MKIIGMGIVGRGEGDRYLKQVLDKNSKICDLIVLWGDKIDEKTKSICLSYENVKLHDCRKKLWIKKQWQIKEHLLNEYVAPLKPDWILPFDMDEVFDYRFNRKKAEELTKRKEIAYQFYCVQLWDSEDKRRVDQGWGGFYNVRFYKFIPEFGLQWARRIRFHCGLAPEYAYKWAAKSEYAFKHYGYLKKEDRLKKIKRYKENDPNGIYLGKWWYASISKKPVLKKFNEKEFCLKLKYQPKKPKIKKLLSMKNPEKIYTVRNIKTGKIYTQKESIIEEWLQRSPDEFKLINEYKAKKLNNNKINKNFKKEKNIEKKEKTTCEICGFKAKSKAGLLAHKRYKHQ